MEILELFKGQLKTNSQMIEQLTKMNSSLDEIKSTAKDTSGEFKHEFPKRIVSDFRKSVRVDNAAAVGIIGLIFLICQLYKGKRKLINFEYWRYAIFLSAPLVIHSISNIVQN